jgi:multiple sugar transport system ATP-binding protein
MASITFDHVTKQFGDTLAVDDLDIHVTDGEFLVLVGPSGCGKTTALRMLAGLEDVTGGRILIGDRVVNNVAPGSRDVAMVFQSYALYPHMTVFDNLAFSLRNNKLPKREIGERVERAAAVLELEPYLKRKPKQLSGGQRQRVALGRAIVREPAVFLMDEPLSNLDAALRVQTRAEILKLQQRLGTTTIYVTHDQVEAMTMGDRIAVMRNGVLQQIGSPEELYLHPANTFVARFIGSPAMNLVSPELVGIGGAGGEARIAGFRPEHVQLGNGKPNAAHYDALVEVVEYLGSEQLAHTRLQDTEVVVKLPVEPRLEAGKRATFSVPLDKVLLFDRETEQALGSAA